MRVHRRIKKTGDVVALINYEKGFSIGHDITRGLYKEVSAEGKIKYYRPTEEGELIEVKIGRQREGMASEEHSQAIRYKTLMKAKNTIKDIVNCNAYSWTDNKGRTLRPKFLTLTFKENLKCLKTANGEFKKFIMRINYHIKMNVDINFEGCQYVSVVEFQKRGAIHYHVLLFNMPFIKWDVILKKWGLGGAYIEGFRDKDGQVVKMTYNDEKQCFMANKSEVHNVGAYITKTMEYMTKSLDDDRLKGQKCYFTSRKLKKPVILNDVPENEKEIEQVTTALSDDNLVFSNVYTNEYTGLCHYKEYNTKFKNISNRNAWEDDIIEHIVRKNWCTQKSISKR